MENQNYFNEFEDLIYDDNNQDQDELALNESFEKYEKESRSEKELEKLLYVKAKKKERERVNKLKEKLEEVLGEREELIKMNEQLKQELERSSHSTDPATKEELINARRELQRLRGEYGALVGGGLGGERMGEGKGGEGRGGRGMIFF